MMRARFGTSAAVLAALALFPAIANGAECWDRNLKVGSQGSDVLQLQQFLNTDSRFAVAIGGVGSSGYETSLYGGLTAKAVSKFQEAYADEILIPNGLTKGTGVVGASTRAKLNASCASNASVPPASGAAPAPQAQGADILTVVLGEQPTSSLAPTFAGVHFMSFTLTAGTKDVSVQDITVERVGAASDAAFDSLALFDEDGLQVGVVARLDANHKATFRRSFVIPAGTTKTFDVYANMNDVTGHGGEMPIIQLDGITASSPVSGSLPLRGNPQTVNESLIVGGAHGYLSSYDPNGDRTRYINDTGVIFSGVRVLADSPEDLEFASLIWTQSGTAGASDIGNVSTVINGTEYPAVQSPYSPREYVSFFDPAIVIKKGTSIDAYIKGDLKVSGAGRTVRFDINDTTDDIGFTGLNYGLGVGIVPGGNTAEEGGSIFLVDADGNSLTPFFKGSVTSISGGAVLFIGR